MKEKKIETPEDRLKKEIKTLKTEARPYLAYRRLILTAAKSEHDPKEVVEGLKFAAEQIDKKNWPLVERVGGTSGDLMARGACPKCEINLVGEDLEPRDSTLPCVIEGCPFDEKVQLTE